MLWDLNTRLMVDWLDVESEANTSLIREEAFKRREKLPQTICAWNSGLLILDGGVYRCWDYHGGQAEGVPESPCTRLQYRESRDGERFEPVAVPPAVRARTGQHPDNVLQLPTRGRNGVWVSGLFHDPLDAEYPFKCVYNRIGTAREVYRPLRSRWPGIYKPDDPVSLIWGIGRSRDGFDWEAPRHEHDLFALAHEHPWLHRAVDGGLVISGQGSRVAEWSYRNVWGVITYDLETAEFIPDYLYQVPQHQARVYAEFTGPGWDRIPWIQPHVGLATMRKGPTVLAQHGYIYGVSGPTPTGCETYFQKGDVGLAVSSTGIGFQDVWPFRPFIPRGERGRWDHGIVVQGHFIELPEETRIYYSASSVGNLTNPDGGTGVAYVPRDRYGYRQIRGFRNTLRAPRAGSFTLKPYPLPARPGVAINVEQARENRWVKVELQDEAQHPLPGYSLADSLPVMHDGLRVPVRWTGGRDASELGGVSVRIRVELHSEDFCDARTDTPRIYAVYMA